MSSKANKIAAKQALEFRKSYGISVSDALSLERLLMRLSVLTVFRPLSSHFSGMAIKASKNEKYILVNSSHPKGKQNFTICHELYHLFMQRDFHFMVCHAGKFDYRGDRTEYYADLFAANLLMPDEVIRGLIPQKEQLKDEIHLETIIRLEQYLGSSRAALLYRLKSLGYISGQKLELFKKNVKKSARLHGKSTTLYEPDYREDHIGDYGDLARELFEAGKISEGHYASLLGDLGIDLSKEADLADV